MVFNVNITPPEVIKKILKELVLEIFILALMVNGIKTYGNNLVR